MATPKIVPIEKPCVSFPRKPTSSETLCRPVSIPRNESAKLYPMYQVAFIGRTGSGRNSLAWRMNNLNDFELPVLEFLPLREVIVDIATRPDFRPEDRFGLRIRIVPPEEYDGEPFFERLGEMHRCDAFVFVVDLGDERSFDEFYTFHRKAMRHTRRELPPFLIVGTKADQKNIELAELHRLGESAERLYSAQGYLECSAKTNDGVGDVLDAVLGIVL